MTAFDRVRASLTTYPRARDWKRLLFEMLWLAPVLALFGWMGGIVSPGPIDGVALARVAAIAIFIPCLVEELIFRVVLLPSPSAHPSLFACAGALLAFLAWHPLQVLWFGEDWGAVVLNPWFLAAAGALGLAATRIYLATSSIWPAILLHWIVVVAWKALGGASPY